MASRKKSSSSRGRDRISGLPDGVLGHILSYLPNKEAGRAAMLSRRWRDIFCSVHTISFEEKEGERSTDWDTYYFELQERRNLSCRLLSNVHAALLRRRRRYGGAGTGLPVPLRSFRFAFDHYSKWDNVAVDQWLFDVLRHSGEELHLDLRFQIGPICKRRDGDRGHDDYDTDPDVIMKWGYVLPARLFSCTAIRTLCLSHCKLNLPGAINLPFLVTMRLTGILGHDSGETIQKLIWSCPRLADLTLEANKRLKKVFLLDKRLRRFALRCCHNLTKVSIDASELRSLDYSGAVPEESLLSLHGLPALSSCSISFCEVRPMESEYARFKRFFRKVSHSKHLHLHHWGLDTRFFAVFPSFPSLTRLQLQAPIGRGDALDAVQRILEQTPNLEVLSLYMDDPEPTQTKEAMYQDDEEDEYHQSTDDLGELRVPNRSRFSMWCLRRRLKEISIVSYRCDVQHRVLASLLFRNALVLERMCVVFAKMSSELKAELRKEIESWVVAKPEKSFR